MEAETFPSFIVSLDAERPFLAGLDPDVHDMHFSSPIKMKYTCLLSVRFLHVPAHELRVPRILIRKRLCAHQESNISSLSYTT